MIFIQSEQRKLMTRGLSILAGLLVLLSSCAPLDAAELDGIWRLKYMEAMGKNYPGKEAPELVVRGNPWKVSTGDPRSSFELLFTVNDATNPRQIDFYSVAKNRLVNHGIYQLQGNVIMVCSTHGPVPEPTPKTFGSDGKTGALLKVYERVARPPKVRATKH